MKELKVILRVLISSFPGELSPISEKKEALLNALA